VPLVDGRRLALKTAANAYASIDGGGAADKLLIDIA